MKKKMIALLLTATISLSSLSGCGVKKACDGNTKEEISLNVITTFAGEDGNAKAYKNAISAFEEETDVKISDSSVTSDEKFKARIETDFRSGAEADVLFFFSGADADSFIKQNKVVSIEEIRETYPDYAKNMKEEAMQASAVDGKRYAVPVNGYWEALFCNKEILDAAGVELPGADYTWEAFLEDCEKIKDAGYTPIAAALGDIPHYWWEYSVFNHTKRGTHTEIPKEIDSGNGPAWVAGMKDIKKLYEKGYFPDNTLEVKDEETFGLFTSGKAAFLLDGSWKLGGIVSACQTDPDDETTLDYGKLDKFTVTYVPAFGEREATDLIGGISMGYYISRKAWEDEAKREAAVSFVNYMTTDKMIADFTGHTTSALKTTPDADPKKFTSLHMRAFEMLDGITSMNQAVQDLFHGTCRSSTFEGMPQIVTGEVSAEDAVAEGLFLYEEQNKEYDLKDKGTCLK